MKFKAAITVVPIDDSKPIKNNTILEKIGQLNISNTPKISIGKYFSLEIDANSKNAAYALVEEISELLKDEKEETASFNIEEI